MQTAPWFVAGLAALVAGAELFVRGASALAAALRISPLVIGLTVVAFGTSAPELAVSLQAGLSGQADLALGNVVGSNIFNILFILGVSALITPLVVAGQLIRLDVPLMIGASTLPLALGWTGTSAGSTAWGSSPGSSPIPPGWSARAVGRAARSSRSSPRSTGPVRGGRGPGGSCSGWC